MIKLNAAKLSIAAIGAACLSMGAGEAAQALTINTTPSWNGSSSITAFGEPNTATYGQTFTVGSDNVCKLLLPAWWP
ncbi:MAG: hypothetical protein HC895_16165 [Leptolyngbyaceae cyanobacterium SM1_3_5]|nr:hypothetical protein [Leptolyngbyaceae cyanobacterium SM1_3_5]